MKETQPVVIAVGIVNQLPLKIDVFGSNPTDGKNAAIYLGSIEPKGSGTYALVTPNIRVTLASSGAIVLDKEMAAQGKITVSPLLLESPFKIPAPPAPGPAQPIPPDTVPWLVGIGKWVKGDKSKIICTREQFWHKAPESFSLPPRSSLQKILTQTTGRTATSSSANSMSTELGVDVNAGWGPFSASVSASLSTNSQRTDTVAIREESTATVDQTFHNDSDAPVVVCLWQLIERIRLMKLDVCVAAVDNAILPLIPLSYQPSAAADEC